MSESTTQETTFRLQFDSQDIFRQNTSERGRLEGTDIDLKGDENKTGRLAVRGIHADLQKVILFFSSLPGDYLRSEFGGPFTFVLNAPASAAIQFRILSTASLIMSTRFPFFRVLDMAIESSIKTSGARGWKLQMLLQHQTVEGEFDISIPLPN